MNHLKLIIFVLFCSNPCLAKWSMGIDPIGMSGGRYEVYFDFGIGDKFSLGLSQITWEYRFVDTQMSIVGYSARLNYHFNTAYSDGWYMSAIGRSLNFDAYNSSGYRGYISSQAAGFAVGYGWFWERFHMILGYAFMSPSEKNVTLRSGVLTQSQPLPNYNSGNFEILAGFYF